MWILASFTRDGIPATGLSPVVYIRDIETGILVISGTLMIEKGDGFYGYDFSTYTPSRDYSIMCDSVTLSGVDRYAYSTSGEYNKVLDNIEGTVGVVDVRTNLIRKIWTNKLELFDGDADNWILYDDDTSTPLLTFSVKDKDGGLIVQPVNSPSKRSGAVGSISGSITPDIYMRKSVYDLDDDGIVNSAGNVSDNTYVSSASEVYQAVSNTHSSYQLGTKVINESDISDNKVIVYKALTDRLEYVTYSGGSASGTVYHPDLLNRDELNQHPASSISVISDTFSGVLSSLDSNNQTAFETLDSHAHNGMYYTKSEIDLLINGFCGEEPISNGANSTVVTFDTPLTVDTYTILINIKNEIDPIPSVYSYTVGATTVSGFTVIYSGDIDSDNYTLVWTVSSGSCGSGLNYISSVSDDTSPALGGDLYINSYGLEMDVTPSGNVIHGYIIGYSGEISQMYVDSYSAEVGSPLHMKSNGHWEVCTALSGTTQMPCGALALEEGNGFKKILWRGIARKGVWSWTSGNVIYVSTTEGALTQTMPIENGVWKQSIGIAVASDTIRFDPGFYPGSII